MTWLKENSFWCFTLAPLLCRYNQQFLCNQQSRCNYLYDKTDMENKSKGTLRKIVEKFYEVFIGDEEFSDDMKKERLLDICNHMQRTETIK